VYNILIQFGIPKCLVQLKDISLNHNIVQPAKANIYLTRFLSLWSTSV